MRPKSADGANALKRQWNRGETDSDAAIDDLRSVHVGDELLNDHRERPLVVARVRYDEMTTRDGASKAVRQVVCETPQGGTVALTNQRNYWSGEVTRVVACDGTAPREARGLRKVGGAGE